MQDFHSKNCGGGAAGWEFETTGRLQEARQVDALKKLMSKFPPDVERVFQWALPGEVTSEKEVRFMKAPQGRNLLGDMFFPNFETSWFVTALHKLLPSGYYGVHFEERRNQRPSYMQRCRP